MVCAWVNTATGSASYRTAFSSFLNASGGNNHRRTLRITDSDSVETDIVDGVGQSGALDGTHPNNTWFNMCGSWVSSASRSAWFNGGTAGNDTTSISPTTPDRTNIGSNFGNFSFPSAAGLAEISVWDLTGFTSGNRDSLAAAVAAGGNPLNITAQVSQPWSGAGGWRRWRHSGSCDSVSYRRGDIQLANTHGQRTVQERWRCIH
jgi:hypothetical protein